MELRIQVLAWEGHMWRCMYEKFEDPKWKSEDLYRKRKRINDLYVAAL